MIELLSLPRRPPPKLRLAMQPHSRDGLPMNSLPGWELIPLNCKLPMLKCPGTQVIFSKDKIGDSFKSLTHDFEACSGDIPEYNPLHDPNLKTFYSNERNLQRLRENGEITDTNFVICTLKDFNEYRNRLHKSQVYNVMQAINRMEEEQLDRLMIANAEAVTKYDHEHLDARTHSRTEIMSRKQRHEDERKQRFAVMWKKTADLMERHVTATAMQMAVLQRQRVLHQLDIEHHQEKRMDKQRTRIIRFKKMSMSKQKRFLRNVRVHEEQRIKRERAVETARWEKRMAERIEQQKRICGLTKTMNDHRNSFIEHHRMRYQQKWHLIEEAIRKRSVASMRRRQTATDSKNLTAKEMLLRGSCIEYQSIFDTLQQTELSDALKLAIDAETLAKLPIQPDDPTYKAARFIMQHIIMTYDKDLSHDKVTYKRLYERVDVFLNEAKQFVLFRSTQILSTLHQSTKENETGRKTSQPVMKSRVSFNNISSTIGMSSYEIHPFADIKDPRDRNPTPCGSLASIVNDSQQNVLKALNAEHMSRNDLVFIEHLLIKFKRELIVGMGTRVFAAIRVHYMNKIMEVRKELVDLDRKFLVKQITKSILSYAKNPLNLEAITKLCVGAMASDIIWSLQQHLLRPERDPRGIVQARRSCKCEAMRNKLCLYGH